MQLNPAEISELIKSRIEGLGASADIKNQGTVVSVTDGICRVHGLSDAMAGEMLEFPPTARRPADLRPGAEPRARLGRRGDPGRVRAHLRRRHRQVHGPHSGSAGRPRADRPRRQRARPADRRQGPDQRQDDRRDREGRAGRDRAPVGEPAGADRPEGDRLDGADRPRPARADHRRPPDRQDRGGDRHDHQPEGSEHDLRLRRDRPEGVARSRTWCARSSSTARWTTPSSSPRRPPNRRRCSTCRPTRAARWASTSATAARTR